MYYLAHIGNVPVEEWAPFLVPVIALWLYGRRQGRRRREAVKLMPDPRELLDEGTIERVVAKWSAEKHGGVSAEHVPLMYPPGPDGMTAPELASRIHSDPGSVERLLEELGELGYLDLGEGGEALDERRVWLTVEGFDLLHDAESVLFAASSGASRSHANPQP
jgi:hypothetical protein